MTFSLRSTYLLDTATAVLKYPHRITEIDWFLNL